MKIRVSWSDSLSGVGKGGKAPCLLCDAEHPDSKPEPANSTQQSKASSS